MNPTPADEALARELENKALSIKLNAKTGRFDFEYFNKSIVAQLISAHVAAQTITKQPAQLSKANDTVTAHFMAETEKLIDEMRSKYPQGEPIHPRAYEFASTYHQYLEASGDDGDMLLIMADRLIREFESRPAAVAAQAPSGLVEALEKIASHKKYMEMLTEKEYGKANHGEAVADTFVDWARDALAAHKAQPDHIGEANKMVTHQSVADVRGMVEVLDEVAKHLRMDDDVISALRVIDAALASARHAMGGEVE